MQLDVFLQLVIASLSTGSIYALVALGLVLAFKGTGLLNFAQGEFVALGAYFALFLSLYTELSYPLVFVCTVTATALAGALIERALLRPLMNAPAFTVVIVTLAIGLMIRNVLRISWQETVSNLPSPVDGLYWMVGGAQINLQYLWIIGASLLLMLLLALFFRLTRTGKAMRAVAQNQTAARLMGVPVGGIFSLTFAISAGMGAIAGMLVAPLTGVESQMGDVLIKAFVAAIIGGFYSLPGAVVGGLIIGLAETFGGAFFGGTFKNLFAFALLILVLLVRPNGLFGRAEFIVFESGSLLLRAKGVPALIAALLLLFGPLLLGNYHQYILSLILVNVIIAVGLNLLIGNAGQISLCSSAFMGIGAYTTVYCITEVGIPFWLSLPIGGLAAALFGLLLGAPAVRVRGFYLAVVTLAFLEIIQVIIREIPDVTGGVRGMIAPRPEAFGFSFSHDLRFYYVVLLVTVLAVYCAHSILRSPIGRQFNAVRNNETVAHSLGISVVRVKLLAFVISAFYAGIGGGLFATLVGFIDPLEFGLLTSIQHVIFIVVGGLGSIVGAVVGASVLTALPEFMRGLKEYNELFFGGLLIVVLIGLPHGLVSLGRLGVVARLRGRRSAAATRSGEARP